VNWHPLILVPRNHLRADGSAGETVKHGKETPILLPAAALGDDL
jgi:hypothetical protein